MISILEKDGIVNIPDDPNDELEVLEDLKQSGKPRPWRPKKMRSLKVADSFERLGEKKRSERIHACGDFLQFVRNIETGKRFLNSANFCRERLCPMCQWRKSLKVFCGVSRVMDTCQAENPNLAPIFLTLTLRSCIGGELSGILDAVFEGWHRFLQDRTIKKRILGWFRTLEITYNKKEDTYHPHIHTILFVDKDYFKSREYLCQQCWAWLWQRALQVDYKPILDIRRIRNKGKKRKSISEVSKYTLKDSEFVSDDNELTDKLVKIYSEALKGRRLYAYGGVLKEIANRFGKENPEDGDLVHINEDTIREDVATVIETYFWHSGVANYVKTH